MRIGHEIVEQIADGVMNLDEFMHLAEQSWLPLQAAILGDIERDLIALGRWHPDDVRDAIEAQARKLDATHARRFFQLRDLLETTCAARKARAMRNRGGHG